MKFIVYFYSAGLQVLVAEQIGFYTHIEDFHLANPYNFTVRLMHHYLQVKGWWSNNVTQITKNGFDNKNLKQCAQMAAKLDDTETCET